MDDIHSWWEVPSIAHFCSLFRVSFDLLDFDIEDLEAALLTDGTEDNGNSLLQELIARLLSGCFGNNSISTFNYQMFLRRLFREKCKEYNFQNPFNSDIDFRFLPLRTKVEILHALCDFRLDADDVMESLKNLDSDSLRVHPLGYDENKSAYWYFYGTRLYREDYEKVVPKKKKKKRGRKKKCEPPVCSDTEDELDLGSGKWQVVCFTESDWERLALKTEDSENRDVQALHQVITEDFLPEIPRLFEEKERLQRKRMLEMQPRRQSTRLEKLKQQKEERKKYEDLCREHEEKVKKKENRKKHQEKRPKVKEEGLSDSEAESHGYSSSSSKVAGRQTNNSLASATGQIVIESSQEKPVPKATSKAGFKSTTEDLQIGMYKILNKLKDHEDAWPFLEPVDEEIAPSYYRVVKTPMDLQQMEDKLNDGLYETLSQFKHDFQLIIANCKQYNGSTNEYTVMCGNLQRVFNMGVHKYLDWEMSEGSDDEMAYLKRYENGTMRSRKGRNRQRSTSSKESCNNTDKENEEKLRECLDSSKFENGINQTDDDSCSLDSKLESKKKAPKELPKIKKSVIIKNTSAMEVQALEEVTEQTLRDINKWLDDTPSFSSASNSPMATLAGSVLDDAEVTSRLDAEYRQAHKLDKPRLPFKEKKRPAKESIVLPLKRKREVQRTIDRLQPGKSKGNLISNKSDDSQITAKQKLIKADLETAPTLSLGTVLNTDLMGFSSKRSSEDKDLEKTEIEPEKSPVDNLNVIKKEEVKTELLEEKPEKATPNLSAWFKAFGAPKTQPTPKRKQETVETSPMYTAYAMNDMVPYDYTLKDTDKKENLSIVDTKKTTIPVPLVSPDKLPPKRQRKISTGSSVSEQSSQNDSWNSPRPSLDEPYLSPQSGNSPQQLKPYQNVLNIPHAPIKVGFYQDAFARPNSDKSSSCSPRNPSSVMTASPHGQSPHQTFTSPCDLPNDSPGNFVGSPHDASCSPHNNVVNSPKESPHHLILSPQDSSNSPYYSPHNVVNSPKEQVAGLADDYQQNQNVYSQYIGSQQSSPQNTYTELYPQQQQPAATTAPIKTQNIFPVKKRVYNECDRPQEMAFTPTDASKEQERVFVPTPGQMPNSNFNSELNYQMGYRNDQTPYQQNMEHQHPPVPVTYQNSLNYLQMARDRCESEQKTVPSSLFNYTAPSQTFVSAPTPHYTSTPLNYSNPPKDAVGYTTAPLNYASRTTSGQFIPPNFKQPTSQPRLNYNNPYEQYPDQINLRPYNYPVLPSKSYPHPIQDLIPGKSQNIDFTTGRPLPNIIPENIGYRYNQSTYPGPSVAEIMKNKIEISQPTYSSPSMAEMIKANQPTYVNTSIADLMKVNQPAYPPNSSVAEMTKSKLEINRSLMMEPHQLPPKPAKKTSKKKKAAAAAAAAAQQQQQQQQPQQQQQEQQQKQQPLPPPQSTMVVTTAQTVVEPARTVEPPRADPPYSHHYPPLVKPPMSSGPFNFNPAIKDGYQDYLNEIRSSGYFADQAAAAAQSEERNPTFAFARPPSGYAPPPLEAYNPPNPSDIYSQFLQRHPMMLHQGLSGFPPPGYLNVHDPMNRHPPWM